MKLRPHEPAAVAAERRVRYLNSPWCPVCKSHEVYRDHLTCDGYILWGWRCVSCERWLRSG